MAAKTRRNSILVVYEGYREGYFLEYLVDHSDVRLNTLFCSGGIKHSARDVNVYVFFDEDFQSRSDQIITDETLEGLAKAWKLNHDALKGCAYRDLQTLNKDMRNPILIVSYPRSIEGFLLRLLGSPLKDLEGKTSKQLKGILEGFLKSLPLHNEDNKKMQSYNEKIAKYKVEIAKQKQSDPNYRQHLRSLEEKIAEYGRKKNRVVFMRFLNDKLPLSEIAARRADIPEADMLLSAFGL